MTTMRLTQLKAYTTTMTMLRTQAQAWSWTRESYVPCGLGTRMGSASSHELRFVDRAENPGGRAPYE